MEEANYWDCSQDSCIQFDECMQMFVPDSIGVAEIEDCSLATAGVEDDVHVDEKFEKTLNTQKEILEQQESSHSLGVVPMVLEVVDSGLDVQMNSGNFNLNSGNTTTSHAVTDVVSPVFNLGVSQSSVPQQKSRAILDIGVPQEYSSGTTSAVSGLNLDGSCAMDHTNVVSPVRIRIPAIAVDSICEMDVIVQDTYGSEDEIAVDSICEMDVIVQDTYESEDDTVFEEMVTASKEDVATRVVVDEAQEIPCFLASVQNGNHGVPKKYHTPDLNLPSTEDLMDNTHKMDRDFDLNKLPIRGRFGRKDDSTSEESFILMLRLLLPDFY